MSPHSVFVRYRCPPLFLNVSLEILIGGKGEGSVHLGFREVYSETAASMVPYSERHTGVFTLTL